MRTQALPTFFIGLTLFALAGCRSAALPEACLEKPDSGRCRAAHTRYYFDPGTEQCKAFIWGGCEGHVPFATREECARACTSAAPATAPVRRSY